MTEQTPFAVETGVDYDGKPVVEARFHDLDQARAWADANYNTWQIRDERDGVVVKIS